MRTNVRKHGRRPAFTIVELLTVMSVIIILFGLLAPAMNKVKIYAKRIKQKNQFRGISIGLELYRSENEDYPDSAAKPNIGASPVTTGAHQLAEALLGRDFQGYDPWSTGDAQADLATPRIYGRPGATPIEIRQSRDRRKGEYLKLESVEAFQIGELYAPPASPGNVYNSTLPDQGAPVFTDVYRTKNIILTGTGKSAKAGTPVLYYKADVHSTTFDYTTWTTSIYNSDDNQDLIELTPMVAGGVIHHFDKDFPDPFDLTRLGRQIFYEAIINPQINSATLIRPYNQDSYILVSAGFDGLYGTRDDVFNFGN